MTNPLILQLRIKLVECQKDFNEIEIKIKRLFLELANLINPFFKTIDSIKAEEIEQCADELLKTKIEAKKLEDEIKDIKTQLGE